MQSLTTEYFPPNNSRGALIRVCPCEGPQDFWIEYDETKTLPQNHKSAAQLTLTRIGWRGIFVMGSTNAGFVFVNSSPEISDWISTP